MSYKAQTSFVRGVFNIANSTHPTFETAEEALRYGELCADRSHIIADYRVVSSNETVTHAIYNGHAVKLSTIRAF